jgi:hypothetical protein
MGADDQALFVQSMASAAKEWLLETQHAYVLQAFERVVNIVNQESNVLSLANEAIGNGPFSLVLSIDSFPDTLTTDSAVKAFQDGLWVGNLLILTSGAKEWDARPDWNQVRQHEGSVLWAAERIAALLREHAQPDSLARLVLDPLASSPLPARIVQVAEQSIPMLYDSIKARDGKALTQAAKQLAGMGPGLTPAGDDLLVGAMYGIWATLPENQAALLSSAIAKAAIPRTHALSGAWLASAARGEAAELWHQLLAAIAGEDPSALQRSVLRILPTGHTSGADALGGFLGVLQRAQQ